jgi:WD40 repeat protein/serine/threonine protein kinase
MLTRPNSGSRCQGAASRFEGICRMDKLIGRTLRGYEIRGVIGLGGFGTVYRAYQSSVARDVAVKVISPNYANSVRFIQNFEREAKLVARLEHPHIVPIYDFWRDPRGAYIVMRFLAGGSLEDELRKNGPWSLERTSTMLDQIAAALAEAHRNNVVHQDIKVANVLLDSQGNSYLSDFGIAKELDQLETDIDEEQILSGDGDGEPPVVHGSPEYMSPEQILRMSVDPRTDIYSLGVVLYEVLTGEKAFVAQNDDSLLRKQLYEKIPLVAQRRPELPPAIDEILQKATSKHPRNRYEDVLQMAREFHQTVQAAEERVRSSTTIVSPEVPAIEAEPVNPYKGLLAFQEGDAADFYGREKLVDRLYLRLLEPGDDARFLAVVGPSGSGKSSVVRAGLLPMLRKNAPRWFIVEMTPDSDPFAQLTDAILRVAIDPDFPYDEIVRRGADGLRTALRHALGEVRQQLVLVIDQFEELFTLTQDETVRRLFIEGLLHTLQPPDSQLRVIITLRADFLDRPLAYSGLSELLSRRVEMIPAMSPADLRRAIEKPAERAKLTLEDGLLAQMITDAANQQNVLPLLQSALAELYETRDKKEQRLTLYAYRDNGGLTGAIESQADRILGDLSADEQRTAQQLFLRLVALGEGVEDTRRRIRRSSLNTPQIDQQNLEKIMALFSKSRLLIFDRDLETREPTIEIAHEAMLKHWKTLRNWISENRDALRIEQQLTQLTRQWQEQNRDTSFLATGARLQQFEDIRGNPNIILQDDAEAFLQASTDRRLRNQRLRTALLITAVAAAFVFAMLFLVAQSATQRANIALDDLEIAQATTVAERNRADAESRIAVSRELSIRSLLDVPETDRRLLLSTAALRIADTDAARNTLFTQLQDFSLLNRFLHGPATTLRAVTYSPDGRWIAGAGADRRVYLWDAATGTLNETVFEHPDILTTIAFNSDGTQLVTGGEDGIVRLWSVPENELLASVELGPEVTQLVLNPDNTLIAAAGDNGVITLLDGQSLEVQDRLEGHEGSVYALAFHPDGQTLASGGTDQVIRIWSIADAETEPRTLTGHTNWIWSLNYSADGALLASTGFDMMVRVWNVSQDYAPFRTLQGHTNFVRSVRFSPNGRILASGGDDGRVIVWDLLTGNPLSAIPFENAQKVWSLSFNPLTPSGSPLVIGGDVPVVPVWNLSEEALVQSIENLPQPARLLRFDDQSGNLWVYGNTPDDPTTVDIGWRWSFADQAYTEKITYNETAAQLTTAIALSSDGTLWASGDSNGAVSFFDATTGQPSGKPLPSNEIGIYSLAFSHDGNRLAVGDDTGQIHLWQRSGDGWEPLDLTLDDHLDRVLMMAFSDDDRYLASGSLDNTVILWEFSDEEAASTSLSAHSEAVMSLAFSPDGSLLLSGGRDSMIAVWDVATRSLRQELRPHTDWVTALTFSTDGQSFASGSSDMTAILWSLREGALNPIGEPLNLSEAVSSVSFNTDNTLLAVGGATGRVRVWQIDTDEWVAAACRIANRTLTDNEVETYLHDLAQPALCQ